MTVDLRQIVHHQVRAQYHSMMFRSRIRQVAKLVLGLLLFAHAALAVAACDCDEHAPAQVIAAMGEKPCCQDEEGAGALTGNANLCLVHCTSDAQSVDTSGPAFSALSTVAVLTASPAPVSGCFVMRRPSPIGYAFAAPPLIILFQNFRI